MAETFTSTLSFFGRVADDISREPVPAQAYRIAIDQAKSEALYRSDDFFVFQDLKPAATDYRFRLESPFYQAREFQRSLPGTAPVELTFDGEDELMVSIKNVTLAARQITFDTIPFLPRIRKGAAVLGEAGFSSTLSEDLGGVGVNSASLVNVTGLGTGKLVRIVRSHSLIAKPGPYYTFPPGTTLLAMRIVEDAPGEAVLARARAQIKKVNALTPSTRAVGAIQIRHVTLSGPSELVMGQDRDLETVSDARGNAVFYFPVGPPVTSLEIEFSHPDHVTKTSVVAMTAERTSVTVRLTPN